MIKEIYHKFVEESTSSYIPPPSFNLFWTPSYPLPLGLKILGKIMTKILNECFRKICIKKKKEKKLLLGLIEKGVFYGKKYNSSVCLVSLIYHPPWDPSFFPKYSHENHR